MTDRELEFLHSAFPRGLYFKDLTAEKELSLLHWPAILSTSDPVAFKIRGYQLPNLLEQLVEHGIGPSTRCAILAEPPITGTISDIAVRTLRLDQKRPVYLLLSDDLEALLDQKALQGQTILVTRSAAQASTLVELLRLNGANVLQAPAINIVLHDEALQELDEALDRIAEYSWMLLTSANSVEVIHDALKRKNKQWTSFESTSIGCIGPATAQAVSRRGGVVSLVPAEFRGESLAEALIEQGVKAHKILLPRAAGSRRILIDKLTEAGAAVHEIKIYRAGMPEGGNEKLTFLFQKPVDFITFTSSSTVHNFMQMARGMEPSRLKNLKAASIGPITSATLREYGIEPAVEAREYTIPGLVQAIIHAVHSAK